MPAGSEVPLDSRTTSRCSCHIEILEVSFLQPCTRWSFLPCIGRKLDYNVRRRGVLTKVCGPIQFFERIYLSIDQEMHQRVTDGSSLGDMGLREYAHGREATGSSPVSRICLWTGLPPGARTGPCCRGFPQAMRHILGPAKILAEWGDVGR